MTLLEDLQWRGLVADTTGMDALAKRLADGPVTLYCGFDPTGDSLHVGHLIGQLTLRRFQLAGHRPVALAGGATGMIGDPSGRSSERNLISPDQLAQNLAKIKKQLSRLLDFAHPANPARLVDNADWTRPLNLLDFLRDTGKHFNLNNMLAKDSVRSRMESDNGISYTEFSYQLLQANDFHHLRTTLDCELQIGGSDQWGNITAGIDLIRKKTSPAPLSAHGLTFPLITKADGTKFGKTASGAVWLDPEKTSPYKFYQFFINTEDAKVCDYLRKFTFLPRPQIEDLERQHAANPGARHAHRELAREVTRLVHGADALNAAERASQILFGAEIGDTPEATFNDVVGEIPTKPVDASRLAAGVPVVELLVLSGLCPSKGQARKDVEGGGIYLNNTRVADPTRAVTAADLLYGKHLLLRKGRRTYTLLSVN
ncbi:MAG: tyrosine--tRNA ligase [Opitutaceae bacterium]|jgi:tyrosyl-tRNA synthetase|nr:tyrosine--tRNA ligase [Opitutaceae bacterium]